MKKVLEFICDWEPTDDEINEAIDIAQKEDCWVHLRWFVRYNGWHDRYVKADTTLDEIKDKHANVYYDWMQGIDFANYIYTCNFFAIKLDKNKMPHVIPNKNECTKTMVLKYNTLNDDNTITTTTSNINDLDTEYALEEIWSRKDFNTYKKVWSEGRRITSKTNCKKPRVSSYVYALTYGRQQTIRNDYMLEIERAMVESTDVNSFKIKRTGTDYNCNNKFNYDKYGYNWFSSLKKIGLCFNEQGYTTRPKKTIDKLTGDTCWVMK